MSFKLASKKQNDYFCQYRAIIIDRKKNGDTNEHINAENLSIISSQIHLGDKLNPNLFVSNLLQKS